MHQSSFRPGVSRNPRCPLHAQWVVSAAFCEPWIMNHERFNSTLFSHCGVSPTHFQHTFNLQSPMLSKFFPSLLVYLDPGIVGKPSVTQTYHQMRSLAGGNILRTQATKHHKIEDGTVILMSITGIDQQCYSWKGYKCSSLYQHASRLFKTSTPSWFSLSFCFPILNHSLQQKHLFKKKHSRVCSSNFCHALLSHQSALQLRTPSRSSARPVRSEHRLAAGLYCPHHWSRPCHGCRKFPWQWQWVEKLFAEVHQVEKIIEWYRMILGCSSWSVSEYTM